MNFYRQIYFIEAAFSIQAGKYSGTFQWFTKKYFSPNSFSRNNSVIIQNIHWFPAPNFVKKFQRSEEEEAEGGECPPGGRESVPQHDRHHVHHLQRVFIIVHFVVTVLFNQHNQRNVWQNVRNVSKLWEPNQSSTHSWSFEMFNTFCHMCYSITSFTVHRGMLCMPTQRTFYFKWNLFDNRVFFNNK